MQQDGKNPEVGMVEIDYDKVKLDIFQLEYLISTLFICKQKTDFPIPDIMSIGEISIV